MSNEDIEMYNKFLDDVFEKHFIIFDQKQKLIEIVKKNNHDASFGMLTLWTLVGILIKQQEQEEKK